MEPWRQTITSAYVTGNVPSGDYDPKRIPIYRARRARFDIGGALIPLFDTGGRKPKSRASTGLTYQFSGIPTPSTGPASIPPRLGRIRTTSPAAFRRLDDTHTSNSPTIPAQKPDPRCFKVPRFRCRSQIGYKLPAGASGLPCLRDTANSCSNRPSGWNTWLTFTHFPVPPACRIATRSIWL